jgi:hypothetical protein
MIDHYVLFSMITKFQDCLTMLNQLLILLGSDDLSACPVFYDYQVPRLFSDAKSITDITWQRRLITMSDFL